MTPSPVQRVRGLAFGVFYRLPGRWRRRLVRVTAVKYIIGGVVLVRSAGDTEGAGGGSAGGGSAGGERLLLLRQPPGHAWSLPGGLLKRGERPVVGAARELAEEAGVRLAPEELSPAVPNTVVHTRGRWVDTVFLARVPADVPLRVDGAEVLEAAWHPIDALPPLTVATARLLSHYGIGPYAAYPEVRE
jgi:ADP-ribose pyrophosphatase YjhB (NUDIX family)